MYAAEVEREKPQTYRKGYQSSCPERKVREKK
jgi:hypothetical protein